MDILAPAGTIESFHAAVESGADAVYLGLKGLNARAYAKNFTLKELALLLPYARKKGVKIHIALNSLTKESELRQLVRTLAALNELGPDAVIIQDLGIYHLIKSYFPRLVIHGSVLMTVHNSPGARQLYEMGFSRVVLAREMSLEEIAAVRRSCPVELEVFVHGALCYSYSGLCLFSSYLGGRGSARGRCTQPCRRRYNAGKRSGYLFSPGDLSAIDMLPELKELGIKTIKIEGRMRSATYVRTVVKAYRMALDARREGSNNAVSQAKDLLKEAMGRRLTRGFYTTAGRKDILSSGLSGNIGQFIGVAKQTTKMRVTLSIRVHLCTGDRLRADFSKTGERTSATLREMKVGRRSVPAANPGQIVTISLPFHCPPGTAFFKVDSKSSHEDLSSKKIWENIKNDAGRLVKRTGAISDLQIQKIISSCKGKRDRSRKPNREPALRFNLRQRIPDPAFLSGRQIIIDLSKKNWPLFSKRLGLYRRITGSICWSVPPVICEKDIPFFEKLVSSLRKKGFRNWEINNLGHLQFFRKGGVRLQAGHQMNLLNSCAFKAAGELGIAAGVISIEADRNDIKNILEQTPVTEPVVTIYGKPALFTSRLIPKGLRDGSSVVSRRKERYFFSTGDGTNYLIAQDPFSLLPFREELTRMGCTGFIIDLSHEHRPLATLTSISGRRRARTHAHFNYKRGLQ